MKMKLLLSVMLVTILVLSFIGCDMDTGYQVEYYKITGSTYDSRPSDASDSAQLSYAKNANGSGGKNTFWVGTYDKLEEKLLEITGAYSITDELKNKIKSQYITTIWYQPGLFQNDYWFFYIENNEYK
jgi:hypothetical protein